MFKPTELLIIRALAEYQIDMSGSFPPQELMEETSVQVCKDIIEKIDKELATP